MSDDDQTEPRIVIQSTNVRGKTIIANSVVPSALSQTYIVLDIPPGVADLYAASERNTLNLKLTRPLSEWARENQLTAPGIPIVEIHAADPKLGPTYPDKIYEKESPRIPFEGVKYLKVSLDAESKETEPTFPSKGIPRIIIHTNFVDLTHEQYNSLGKMLESELKDLMNASFKPITETDKIPAKLQRYIAKDN